jgi:hypothetical protein
MTQFITVDLPMLAWPVNTVRVPGTMNSMSAKGFDARSASGQLRALRKVVDRVEALHRDRLGRFRTSATASTP